MARTSLSQMPPFARHERNQEATRKRIVRDLLREADECERRAAKARKLAAKASTLDTLRDKRVLAEIVNYGGSGPQYWVAELFGVRDQLWKVEKGGTPYFEPRREFLIECIEGFSRLYPSYFRRTPRVAAKPVEPPGAYVEPFPENVIEFPLTPERRYELAMQKIKDGLLRSNSAIARLSELTGGTISD